MHTKLIEAVIVCAFRSSIPIERNGAGGKTAGRATTMDPRFDTRLKPSNICVLLLEDDDGDAYLTKRALSGLQRIGQVKRVRNGEEAISLLESGAFTADIALVDLQMPILDGLDFLKACVDRRLANIPMVVLTSSSARNDLLRSRVSGALRVITKPEDPLKLREALHEAIEAFVPADAGSRADGMQVWSLAQATAGAPAVQTAAAGSAAPSFGRRTAPNRV